MTVLPAWERPEAAESPASPPPELQTFARIEGMIGEEAALLTIPAHERSEQQRNRLRAITDELDRLSEALRGRAARHAEQGAT
jgi:hypothetical protein